jgi:hypothetical protein
MTRSREGIAFTCINRKAPVSAGGFSATEATGPASTMSACRVWMHGVRERRFSAFDRQLD